MSNTVMLEHSDVAIRLPVQDLERARLFYAEKLGLEPVEERPGDFSIDAEAGPLPCSSPAALPLVTTHRWGGRSKTCGQRSKPCELAA